MQKQKRVSIRSTIVAFVLNTIIAYAVYMICRIEFLLENWTTLAPDLTAGKIGEMLTGSLVFDTSAIAYTGIVYLILMLIPCYKKESKGWQTAAKWVFLIVNTLCAIANLGDSVYFRFTGRRTTMSVFQEFANEDNIGSILTTELIGHWYLVLMLAVLVFLMAKLYVMPEAQERPRTTGQWVGYYATHTIAMGAFIVLTIIGMRGGATTATRPITITNANQYVDKPAEAALILNTPFSMIRTIGKKTFRDPMYMSREEMESIYSPVHTPADTAVMRKKNVVVLIVESFGREFIGAYNERLDGGQYKGYAPFMDSLYSKSMSFDYTFCNGRKSIDGMPSVLSSIPMFVEPFFLTPAAMNEVGGMADCLGRKGYETGFFHGAANGSMGFMAFARATGFDGYYGRTEYDEDKRFNGDHDFDGTWAIWDEPFLQFYALKMSEMKEPFMTAVFTASSHHPFVIPEAYRDTFPEEGGSVMHKCIRYTDHSIRKFFETASLQPWYKNTIFVMTSDHTNMADHAEYKTDLGLYGSPILIFDPSGEIPAGRRHCIAQQIDIMPTILDFLGYDEPYIAFGKDLLTTPDSATWAVNYNNGIYQYVKRGRFLQFDGQESRALYDIDNDWMLTTNLKDKEPETLATMERELKAIIQQYMERMSEDRITIRPEDDNQTNN